MQEKYNEKAAAAKKLTVLSIHKNDKELYLIENELTSRKIFKFTSILIYK